MKLDCSESNSKNLLEKKLGKVVPKIRLRKQHYFSFRIINNN